VGFELSPSEIFEQNKRSTHSLEDLDLEPIVLFTLQMIEICVGYVFLILNAATKNLKFDLKIQKQSTAF
jgi:hypothetical protein